MLPSRRQAIEQLFSRVSSARVTFVYDDGAAFTAGQGPALRVRWSDRATLRTLRQGMVGLGDAFTEREWEVEQGTLLELLTAFATSNAHQQLKEDVPWAIKARFLWERTAALLTRAASHASVRSHYDLGNDFFGLWLDGSMTYTCGYALRPDDSLEQLQAQKLALVCRKLRVAPGHTLLDLGCGWGSLALHAAGRKGAKVTAVNVSRPQLDWLEQRVAASGLGAAVRVVNADFAEVGGTFDRVVSVGLAEHCGKRRLPELFRVISSRLREGGLGLVHTIGSADTGGTDPWIERRIFPGAYVPTLSELVRAAEDSGLRVNHVENIGYSYGLTLRQWLERFLAHRAEVERRHGDRFCRTWELYLTMLIPTFEHLSTSLFQVVVSKGPGPSRDALFPIALPGLDEEDGAAGDAASPGRAVGGLGRG